MKSLQHRALVSLQKRLSKDGEPDQVTSGAGMALEIGIVGLPNSGKTTIFNALTRAGAEICGVRDRLREAERRNGADRRRPPRRGRAGGGARKVTRRPSASSTPGTGAALLATCARSMRCSRS